MLKKISVAALITCGPGMEKYVPDCLESLKAQTMPFTEIILVYDGTQEGQAYEGVTTVIRNRNKGVSRSRHEAFLLSTSENILFVDADDQLSENFVEMMVWERLKHPHDILYPNVLLWAKWGTSQVCNRWHESDGHVTKKNMIQSCKITVSSLIPREVYEKCGPMEELPILEDYAFWMKAIEAGYTFSKVPHCYLKYRQRKHGRNMQSDELRNEIYQKVRERYENVGHKN